MSFGQQIQLPTPGDTPRMMEQEEDSPSSYANNSSTWTPADGTTLSTNPSRKRSRDETSFEDYDPSYFSSIQQVNTPAAIPEDAVAQFPSMSNVNQNTSMIDDTTDQQVNSASHVGRPRTLSSRKSARLSQSSIKFRSDSVSNSAPASPPKSGAASFSEADEATLALGIGWTKISSEEESMQAAARGWSKYIENHYRSYLHNPEIILKSSGLNAYLVRSDEGFFLFGDDLLEARLVGSTWDTTVQNLRVYPIRFEGETSVRAARTPGPESIKKSWQQQQTQDRVAKETIHNWADFNRINNASGHAEITVGSGGMDLD